MRFPVGIIVESGITPEDLAKLLKHVERKLEKEGVPIHLRPLEAIGEVSRHLSNIALPIVGGSAAAARFPNAWISVTIHDWYKRRYGDRLKIDALLGRVAVLLRGDVWIIRIPIAYGRLQVVSSHDRIAKRTMTRGPAICNVVDCIYRLPEGVRSSLSKRELKELAEIFLLGFCAFRDIFQIGKAELVRSARSDFDEAVNHLTTQSHDYGKSKWASLQATEKMLKAFIAGKGHQFSKLHKLEKVAAEAEASGLPPIDPALLSAIQCEPGVRYGEISVTRDEALRAHHDALQVARFMSSSVVKGVSCP